MKSIKENPCAIPDTPDTYDDICIPGGKDFSILTPAVRTKLPNTGEDVYTAKALMYNGTQYLGGGYLAFELRWNLPAGGVNAIEWEHPDSVMPTNGIFYPCRHLLAPDNVTVPAPNGGTYLALTDNFLNNIKDDRGFWKIVYEAHAVLDSDTPDEFGELPVYTIRWNLRKNDVYDPDYCIDDRINDIDWSTPDEIVPSESYVYSPKTGILRGISTSDSYGGEDLMKYTVHWVKIRDKVTQWEPEEDNPSGLSIMGLQNFSGKSAEATYMELYMLGKENQVKRG